MGKKKICSFKTKVGLAEATYKPKFKARKKYGRLQTERKKLTPYAGKKVHVDVYETSKDS